MNRRLALAVPSAALLIGLGAFAVPASAETVAPNPMPNGYGVDTPEAPDGGTTDTPDVTPDTPDVTPDTPDVTPDVPTDEGVSDDAVTDDTDTPKASTPGTVSAVSPNATSNSGSLPFTGTESLLVLGLAAGALTTGVVLVGVGRRRTS